MNRTFTFLGKSHSDWLPVRSGESGDSVFRREDGQAYAKIAPAARRNELAAERDRLTWLKGRGVACPEVINWQEEEEGACLVMTAIPGMSAVEISGADLLEAWPSMAQQLGAVHGLSVDQCPFERKLSEMFGRAVDVVSRNAVNPDFLPDEDRNTPQAELLAQVERDLSVRLDQESTDMVVCHGDPCMPNFMVDPKTLQCTGLIDLGRLGKADRYADLALMIANAEENWTTPVEAERALAVLFNVLGIEALDRERLAFYLRLDPLTWVNIYAALNFCSLERLSIGSHRRHLFNLCLKVLLPSGTPAIVKALKPVEDIADELRGSTIWHHATGGARSGCSVLRTT